MKLSNGDGAALDAAALEGATVVGVQCGTELTEGRFEASEQELQGAADLSVLDQAEGCDGGAARSLTEARGASSSRRSNTANRS